MLSKHLFVVKKKKFNRVYILRFCTKYDTWFSKYRIELIVALSSTNATKTNQSWVRTVFWYTHKKEKRNPIAISFGTVQPARTAQADLSRYFLQLHLNIISNSLTRIITWIILYERIAKCICNRNINSGQLARSVQADMKRNIGYCINVLNSKYHSLSHNSPCSQSNIAITNFLV